MMETAIASIQVAARDNRTHLDTQTSMMIYERIRAKVGSLMTRPISYYQECGRTAIVMCNCYIIFDENMQSM